MRIFHASLRLAGLVLVVVGAAKVFNGLNEAVGAISVKDPVFGLRMRELFLAVGLLEMGAGAFALFNSRVPVVAALLAWLATDLVLYRVGLAWAGAARPCNCMAGLANAFSLTPETADRIMLSILLYLLVASFGTLAWLYLFRPRTHLRMA